MLFLKKKSLVFLLLLCFFLLIACGGDEKGDAPSPTSSYLNVNNKQTTLEIPAGNTKATLVITASPDCEWAISWDNSQMWVKSVSPINGRGSQNVDLTVEANTNVTSRSCRMTVTNTNGIIPSFELIIQQSASSSIFELHTDGDKIPFGSTGGEQLISFSCNTDWAVEGPSWVGINPEKGNGDGTITVTSLPNTSNSERTGMLTFRPLGGTPKTLSLVQAAASLPTVFVPEITNIGKTEATVTFGFESEVKVTTFGICFSETNKLPDIDHDQRITENGEEHSGTHRINLTGLKSETTYYVRSYAISSAGLQYCSETVTFTTLNGKPAKEDNIIPNP